MAEGERLPVNIVILTVPWNVKNGGPPIEMWTEFSSLLTSRNEDTEDPLVVW